LNPVFTIGAQLLEIMRWHAPDDGSRGGERRRKHVERLVMLLRRMQVPDAEILKSRVAMTVIGGEIVFDDRPRD